MRMNKGKINLEEEVAKTLSSFEGISKAEPKPFFYTRLKAKMESQDKTVVSLKWSMAAIALLLVINAFSVWNFWSESVSTEDSIEVLASEYNMIETDLYSTLE